MASCQDLAGTGWYEYQNATYDAVVSMSDVIEKTTDCFRITMKVEYIETKYYEQVTTYAPGPPEICEKEQKSEETILYSNTFTSSFSQGENLYNHVYGQLTTIQADLDGYLKSEDIIDKSAGAINHMNLQLRETVPPGWTPSG